MADCSFWFVLELRFKVMRASPSLLSYSPPPHGEEVQMVSAAKKPQAACDG